MSRSVEHQRTLRPIIANERVLANIANLEQQQQEARQRDELESTELHSKNFTYDPETKKFTEGPPVYRVRFYPYPDGPNSESAWEEFLTEAEINQLDGFGYEYFVKGDQI